MTELSLKTGLTFAVAAVYAAVGHGGASGYLAILSFFGTPHDAMASSALCLNLLVSGVAFAAYARAGHFAWSLSWPFALTSVPAAFVGGLLKISAASYAHLLAGVLVIGGGQLLLKKERTPAAPKKYFPRWVSLGGGAALGILSGMVGVGGGIFKSASHSFRPGRRQRNRRHRRLFYLRELSVRSGRPFGPGRVPSCARAFIPVHRGVVGRMDRVAFGRRPTGAALVATPSRRHFVHRRLRGQ
ncbi:MAG: sulfite exporter TauE/SafE family protein [Elusimicrobia bacterium]|nr:sulfite exporter TauE/SafE family protein [Elusimicrobiota bacterium]